MDDVLVSFSIPGRLRGKGRHRSRLVKARDGRQFVHNHPDKKTEDAEAMVRSFASDAMDGRPPFDGPLVLQVSVRMNTTASWSKKKRAETVYITGKPDIDNQIKLIGDACNGILWKDDSQLCAIHFGRKYDDSHGERVDIIVRTPVTQAVTERQPAAEQRPIPLFAEARR